MRATAETEAAPGEQFKRAAREVTSRVGSLFRGDHEGDTLGRGRPGVASELVWGGFFGMTYRRAGFWYLWVLLTL